MLYAAWIVDTCETNNHNGYSPTGPMRLILPLRGETLSLHCFVEFRKPKMPIGKQKKNYLIRKTAIERSSSQLIQ